MRVVMIVPTGIGCPIGGHAGDANPAAALLSSVCDELIVHPNVVNASDINEMRDNVLYVEGSALDAFLRDHIALRRVKCGSNRVLVVTNSPAPTATRNAVGAARATLGLDVEIMELLEPLKMEAYIDEGGAAAGLCSGIGALVSQVRSSGLTFDAVAVSSEIEVDRDVAFLYLRVGGVNPWGCVEAMVSKEVSKALGIPVAHAPVGGVIDDTFDEVVDDRRAAECVSTAYLHCVLKGLRRSPQLISAFRLPSDLTVNDIDMLVSPASCWGPPHDACAGSGIEIVWVEENLPEIALSPGTVVDGYTLVANYLEAAGLIAARLVGVSVDSVTR